MMLSPFFPGRFLSLNKFASLPNGSASFSLEGFSFSEESCLRFSVGGLTLFRPRDSLFPQGVASFPRVSLAFFAGVDFLTWAVNFFLRAYFS